jgi:hypothetical protein
MTEDMNRLAAIAELAQALHILGEPGPAARLYDALLPYADRNIVNARGAAGYGSASLHLGLLANLLGRDAEHHFEAARRHNERLGAKVWLDRQPAHRPTGPPQPGTRRTIRPSAEHAGRAGEACARHAGCRTRRSP